MNEPFDPRPALEILRARGVTEPVRLLIVLGTGLIRLEEEIRQLRGRPRVRAVGHFVEQQHQDHKSALRNIVLGQMRTRDPKRIVARLHQVEKHLGRRRIEIGK